MKCTGLSVQVCEKRLHGMSVTSALTSEDGEHTIKKWHKGGLWFSSTLTVPRNRYTDALCNGSIMCNHTCQCLVSFFVADERNCTTGMGLMQCFEKVDFSR